MKLIIFFIYAHLVYSELHTFMIIYTERSGKTTAGTPEFSAVTTLDDLQIDYNDSDTMELTSRKKWMKEFAAKHEDWWKKYTEIREKLQQVYKLNIHDIMEQFNKSPGVYTYQRMYGCEWNKNTGDVYGFDRHNYDGEDIIQLDWKEVRYNISVEKAKPIVQKWNNDTEQLESLKRYNKYCAEWLSMFLSKATTENADPPKVTLLPKNSGCYVECRVTGFLYRNTAISWKKNGEVISDNKTVENGEPQPNEDGTFWRNLTLYVPPDDWKKNQYACVVEHKSLTEPIQMILTEDEIKSSKPGSDASSIIILVIVVLIVLIVLCSVYWKCKKKDEVSYKVVNKVLQNLNPSVQNMH